MNDWMCPECQGNGNIFNAQELSWHRCQECSCTGVMRSRLDYALASIGLSGDGTIEGWKAISYKKQKELQKIMSDIQEKEQEIDELLADKSLLESHRQLLWAAITYHRISTGKIPCVGQLSLEVS